MRKKLSEIIKKSCNLAILQFRNKRNGFTLVELLVVMALMTTIAVIGLINITGYRDKQDVRTAGQQVAAILRDAQNRAISGEGGGNWGVHFDNTISTSPFYAMVSGTTYSVSNIFSRVPMPLGIIFTSPASSTAADIFFSAITGRPTGTTMVTISKNSSVDAGISDIVAQSGGQISSNYDYGLAGYWHFDEGSGVTSTDASGNRNNGSLVSGPTWQAGSNCKSGSCLSFNGSSDYINIGLPNSLNFSARPNLSIFAWIKPHTIATYQGIIGIGAGAQSTTRIGFGLGGVNNLRVDWGNGTTYQTFYSTDNALTVDTWMFVGFVVKSDNTLQIYINGIANNTLRSIENLASLTGYLWNIGRNYQSSNYSFNGSIDEIRIYNRALSAAEILNLYNALK